MSGEVTRRSILQMAMAPALLAQAQVGDMPPTVSKVYPGAGRQARLRARRPGQHHPRCLARRISAAAASRFRPCRSRKRSGRSPATTPRTCRPRSTRSLRCRSTGTASAGPCCSRAGYYRMATPVTIQASGVVLRGEGHGRHGHDPGRHRHGPAGPPRRRRRAARLPARSRRPPPPRRAAVPAQAPRRPRRARPWRRRAAAARPAGPRWPAAVARRPRWSAAAAGRDPHPHRGRVGVTPRTTPSSASPTSTCRSARAASRGVRPRLQAGDTVIVRRIGNQDWIDEVGMNSDAPGGRWQPFNIDYDRVVTEVQGNTITVDVPITCAIEKRWGGGEVIKYDDPGRIEHVGVENLRGVSEFDPSVRTRDYGNMDRQNYAAEEYYSDENHYNNFVVFDNIKNGWVRNATALHFVTSMVGTQRGSKWITMQDCVSREPISQRRGGRRFIFALRGQLALVQRCQSDKGRHSFMTGQPTRQRQRVPRLQGDEPVFVERAARAVGDRRPLRQHRSAADRALLEEHHHRLGRRQHGVLELQGRLPGAEAADGAELRVRPHRRQRGRLQHPAAGHDEGERAHRVARPSRHAAQPVSDAAARAARRRGRAQHRAAEPARLMHVKPRALFIASSISLATCAVSFAVRGDVAGAMGSAFHLTNEQVGIVLSPAFYGFALAILLGGLVIDAVGMRLLHALSGASFIVGVALIILAPRPDVRRAFDLRSRRHDAALRRLLPVRHRARTGRVRHQSAARVDLPAREDQAHHGGTRVVAGRHDSRRAGDAGAQRPRRELAAADVPHPAARRHVRGDVRQVPLPADRARHLERAGLGHVEGSHSTALHPPVPGHVDDGGCRTRPGSVVPEGDGGPRARSSARRPAAASCSSSTRRA